MISNRLPSGSLTWNAVTLEVLEHQVRVPLDDQVGVAPDNPERESAWAENEDRRQARLAGGA